MAATMLALAPLHLPLGYYSALRIVVFIVCALLVWREKQEKDPHLWNFVFIPVGLLFNPVLPIFLNDRNIWMPIDIGCAALFCAYVLHPIIIKRERLH